MQEKWYLGPELGASLEKIITQRCLSDKTQRLLQFPCDLIERGTDSIHLPLGSSAVINIYTANVWAIILFVDDLL